MEEAAEILGPGSHRQLRQDKLANESNLLTAAHLSAQPLERSKNGSRNQSTGRADHAPDGKTAQSRGSGLPIRIGITGSSVIGPFFFGPRN